jgi:hypothetical protein
MFYPLDKGIPSENVDHAKVINDTLSIPSLSLLHLSFTDQLAIDDSLTAKPTSPFLIPLICRTVSSVIGVEYKSTSIRRERVNIWKVGRFESMER